jgi:hypothetical protein
MEIARPNQSIPSIFRTQPTSSNLDPKRESPKVGPAQWRTACVFVRAVCLLLFVAPAFAAPALCQKASQEAAQPPAQLAPSVVEAAQQARERESQSTKHAKLVTNDDLAPQLSVPASSASAAAAARSSNATSNTASEAPADQAATCENPEQAEALTAELRNTQDERDQIQQELSYQAPVISDNDLDLTNFKSGNSGIGVGSLPTLESQPVAPARVTQVALDAQIASLKKALLVACEPPGQANIQKRLDAIEEQLKWARRQLALDQAAFYSSPSYATDTAGKARLDAEQQSIDSLLAQKDILSDQLPAANPNAALTQD